MSKNEENLTRVYTINLGKCWITPSYKRTDRVINMIRDFAKKNMDSEKVKIDQDLNIHIWSRGKTNPPRKIRVRMIKDDDEVVIVSSYTESKHPTENDEKAQENSQTTVKTKDSQNA